MQISATAKKKQLLYRLVKPFIGDQNETVQLGLLSGICVLSLLLILQTIGVAVFIYKVKSTARNAVKKDINPIYGVEDEEEAEDKNLRSDSLEESYDYMGH